MVRTSLLLVTALVSAFIPLPRVATASDKPKLQIRTLKECLTPVRDLAEGANYLQPIPEEDFILPKPRTEPSETFQIHSGAKREALSTNGFEVYELGAGGGGTVYRIYPQTKPELSVIEKRYTKRVIYESDVIAYEDLYEASQSSDFGFEVVNLLGQIPEKKRLRLRDIRGTDLQDVLENPNTSPALKQRLITSYLSAYEKAKTVIREKLKPRAESTQMLPINPHSLPMYHAVYSRQKAGKTVLIRILIKPENIIVTPPPELKLYLVDPR